VMLVDVDSKAATAKGKPSLARPDGWGHPLLRGHGVTRRTQLVSIRLEACLCDPHAAALLDDASPKTPVGRFQTIYF